MRKCVLPALAVLSAVMMASPAQAVDTSSLGAFVASCSANKDDAKLCLAMTSNAILSAKNAKYGCVPADLGDDKAADKLLDWLKTTANANPKYQKEALSDLFWTGIDEIWPCKK